MYKWLLIGAGGAAGSLMRYALAGWCQRLTGGVFPVGTLTVNLVGCLLVGFLTAALTGPLLIREEYRIALIVGVLGGFTTFSTFGYETFSLVNNAQWTRAAWNVVLTNVLGLASVWLGYRVAQKWLGM